MHVAFREAMASRLLELERSLGFVEMLPVTWNDYQVEASKEVAEHPSLKQAVADIGGVWEVYLSDTWRESMAEIFGSDWRKSQVALPRRPARVAPAGAPKARASLEAEAAPVGREEEPGAVPLDHAAEAAAEVGGAGPLNGLTDERRSYFSGREAMRWAEYYGQPVM